MPEDRSMRIEQYEYTPLELNWIVNESDLGW